MNFRRILIGTCIATFLTLSACTPGARSHDVTHDDLNAGYALLYSLLNDESQVGKILILKSVSAQAKKLIQDIARASDDGRRALLQFAKNDDALGLDTDDLPIIETQTREAISKTTTGELLGHSNAEFELRLLLTQSESMQYASHLSAAIAKAEPDKARKKALEEWSANFQKLRGRVLMMLTIR